MHVFIYLFIYNKLKMRKNLKKKHYKNYRIAQGLATEFSLELFYYA